MKRKILFTVPTFCLLTCLVWLQPHSSVVASRPDKETIAIIDFFGYGHFDVVKLRSVLSTSDGRRTFSAATAAFTLRPVSTMFASCAFWMSSVIAGRPLIRAKARHLLLAVDDVGHLRQEHRASALLRDDDAAELLRILDLALDADDRVVLPARDPPRRHVLVRVLGSR